jgi:hypothetical protein
MNLGNESCIKTCSETQGTEKRDCYVLYCITVRYKFHKTCQKVRNSSECIVRCAISREAYGTMTTMPFGRMRKPQMREADH